MNQIQLLLPGHTPLADTFLLPIRLHFTNIIDFLQKKKIEIRPALFLLDNSAQWYAGTKWVLTLGLSLGTSRYKPVPGSGLLLANFESLILHVFRAAVLTISVIYSNRRIFRLQTGNSTKNDAKHAVSLAFLSYVRNTRFLKDGYKFEQLFYFLGSEIKHSLSPYYFRSYIHISNSDEVGVLC